MKKLIYLLILICVFVSCKKKTIETLPSDSNNEPTDTTTGDTPSEPIITVNHSYDTIFPSDYIMAYPGSWWEYNSGEIDSCTGWINIPIRTLSTNGGDVLIDEDMWVLPENLNNLGVVAGDNSIYNSGQYNETFFTPILDTNEGVFYQTQQYVGGIEGYTLYRTFETMEKLDSIVIGNETFYDVLHVRHTDQIEFHAISGGPLYIDEFWFAKNIGKIKIIRHNQGSVSEFNIVDYHIQPY